MKKSIIALSLLLGTTAAHAASVSAVNSQSCLQMKGTDEPFVLVLKKGESVVNALHQCANDAKLSGAALSGIGAVINTTLSCFDHEAKTYQERTYPEFLELVALTGNINVLDGKRATHIHVALSDHNYNMMGGHLANATVGATAEITVTPMQHALVKTADSKTGLNLIVTSKKAK